MTKPITPAQAKTLYDLLKEYHDLHRNLRSTAMQLFIHPEATANQVMDVQQQLVRHLQHYQQLYKRVFEATRGGQLLSTAWRDITKFKL